MPSLTSETADLMREIMREIAHNNGQPVIQLEAIPIANWHISTSRNIYLKVFQIDRFLQLLKQSLSSGTSASGGLRRYIMEE